MEVLDINNRFTYHQPQSDDTAKYVEIREAARELAHLINKRCPESREKSLAITKLEEVVFWANAGIARDQ